jgi:hypothetical protein
LEERVNLLKLMKVSLGKEKYHRGHYVKGQWVFGGVERGAGRTFFRLLIGLKTVDSARYHHNS